MQEFDIDGLSVVGLVALCDIEAESELGIDYGYYSALTANPIECHCGSENCRGWI